MDRADILISLFIGIVATLAFWIGYGVGNVRGYDESAKRADRFMREAFRRDLEEQDLSRRLRMSQAWRERR